MELPPSFPHSAPKGYSYETTLFKRNLLAIWICNHGKFSYTSKTPRSIWGFYNIKQRSYFTPINSSTVGKEVDIASTTCYSSMQLNLNALAKLLYA